MTREIHLREELGSHLGDGAAAHRLRVSIIDPWIALDSCERVVLEFTGVRVANSGFMNALISGLLEEHGEVALRKLAFRGCLPTIQVLVQWAVELGLTKREEESRRGRREGLPAQRCAGSNDETVRIS